MATFFFISFCKIFLLFSLVSFLKPFSVSSVEFQVGDGTGWAVPNSETGQSYNQWASENRFQISDTVHFKYQNDSVMEVTGEEYERCVSPRPSFFSNTGDTVFVLDRPGYFYFISGITSHCLDGEKMIIKVLEPEKERSSSSSSSSSLSPSQASSQSYSSGPSSVTNTADVSGAKKKGYGNVPPNYAVYDSIVFILVDLLLGLFAR
ncbi:early nodulin-like protein 5 [Malania oleifera]|uniref:early nodulin-like protein 5 n=1 Tax=Malania oleifera TaxID=397392 RepID=UPI0025AE3EE5|nr:early nodulin-like protein 5 [Malania oleifera]